MKKILSAIGAVFTYVFGTLLLLTLSPLIITVVILDQGARLYAAMWSSIRRDPKHGVEIKNLPDKTWHKAETKDDFVRAFKRLSDKIADLSGAKQGKLTREGFEIFDNIPKDLDWTDLRISQTLKSKHAEIELSLQIGAYTSENGALDVTMNNSDDHDDSSWPPALAKVIAPNLHTEREFTLWSSPSVWAVVGLLRGEFRFAQPSGQLWVHIPEHNVWMVQYKINGDQYGLRKNFTNSFARKYKVDKNTSGER